VIRIMALRYSGQENVRLVSKIPDVSPYPIFVRKTYKTIFWSKIRRSRHTENIGIMAGIIQLI